MAGTYSQLYIQVVFAVKGRENLIAKTWRDELDRLIVSPLRGLALYAVYRCYNNGNPSGLFCIQKGLAELKELM